MDPFGATTTTTKTPTKTTSETAGIFSGISSILTTGVNFILGKKSIKTQADLEKRRLATQERWAQVQEQENMLNYQMAQISELKNIAAGKDVMTDVKVGGVIILIGVGLAVYFKKRKKN